MLVVKEKTLTDLICLESVPIKEEEEEEDEKLFYVLYNFPKKKLTIINC
jgi:hypothetical protein